MSPYEVESRSQVHNFRHVLKEKWGFPVTDSKAERAIYLVLAGMNLGLFGSIPVAGYGPEPAMIP